MGGALTIDQGAPAGMLDEPAPERCDVFVAFGRFLPVELATP